MYAPQIPVQSFDPCSPGVQASSSECSLIRCRTMGSSPSNQSIHLGEHFRSLLKIPTSTPLLPLYWDLNLKQIHPLAALKPLLYWIRVWTTPELLVYRACLQEILTLNVNIPWLAHIKSNLTKLGFSDYWHNPNSIPSNASRILKCHFWNSHYAQAHTDPNVGSLTLHYLTFKTFPKFETFLDTIEPPFAKSLYLKFRLGTLPTRAFCTKWANHVNSQSLLCPSCSNADETVSHILFFCPSYHYLRKLWIKPLCNNLGIRNIAVALRIFLSDTSSLIVFTLSNFLFRAWYIRSRYLKRPVVEPFNCMTQF